MSHTVYLNHVMRMTTAALQLEQALQWATEGWNLRDALAGTIMSDFDYDEFTFNENQSREETLWWIAQLLDHAKAEVMMELGSCKGWRQL